MEKQLIDNGAMTILHKRILYHNTGENSSVVESKRGDDVGRTLAVVNGKRKSSRPRTRGGGGGGERHNDDRAPSVFFFFFPFRLVQTYSASTANRPNNTPPWLCRRRANASRPSRYGTTTVGLGPYRTRVVRPPSRRMIIKCIIIDREIIKARRFYFIFSHQRDHPAATTTTTRTHRGGTVYKQQQQSRVLV